jgi:hypothetical protein
MALASKKEVSKEIAILPIYVGTVDFYLVGTTPMIENRMAEKAKRTLLLPSGRKNDAEKAATLKHDPPQEYRDSVYKNFGPKVATRLKIPSAAFKGAMQTAALDLPGATKSAIGRLVSIPHGNFDVFGTPQLLMAVVRSADIARTPDIRTRAILPRWACKVSVNFVQPKLNATSIFNLFAAGGITSGVGDWRQEKGSGSHGLWRICEPDDPEYLDIQSEGRVAQDSALETYQCYDQDTQELLDWYLAEIVRRGRGGKKSDRPIEFPGADTAPDDPTDTVAFATAATTKKRRSNGRGAHA